MATGMRPRRPADATAPASRTDERGQGVVEYGLILSLSALVAAVVLLVFGSTLSAVLEVIGEAIEQAS